MLAVQVLLSMTQLQFIHSGNQTHLLHQLSASERLIDSPFGRDPEGVLAEAHAAGADGLIVTVRTERDAEEALQLLAKLR